MPIIPPPSGLLPLVEIPLNGQSSLTLTQTTGGRTVITLGGSCSFGVANLIASSINIPLNGQCSFGLRKNNEPDTFGQTEISLSGQCSFAVAKTVSGRVVITPSSQCSFGLFKKEAQIDEIRCIVDIVPPTSTDTYLYQHWRLLINDVEVECTDFEYSISKNGRIGETLTVTLADPSDRAVIIGGNSVKFQIGKFWNGAWSNLDTLVDQADLSSSDFNLAELGNDRFQFSSVSQLAKKLNKSPETDIIFYDPLKMSIDPADLDILTDNFGRQYVKELVSLPNFKLDDLFEKVFVDRCGFASYRSNLPNYPLSRVDCEIGTGYMDSVGGHFGYCEPDIDVIGNEIQILDSSYLLSPTDPLPRIVTASNWKTARITTNLQPVDAIRLSYSEDRLNWDYYDLVTKVVTNPLTRTGGLDEKNTTETITTVTREYKQFANPFNVVRRELQSEVRSIVTDGIEVSRTEELVYFDTWGRETARNKDIYAYVPDFLFTILGPELALKKTRREYTETHWAAHPFKPSQQYVSVRSQQVYSAVVVDGNFPQLDRPFERPLEQYYRGGNIEVGQTVQSLKQVLSVVETATPLRDGSVDIRTTRVDHLINNVPEDYTENRQGDIAQNGISARRFEKLVYLDSSDSRDPDKRIIRKNAGPVPLADAEAWAKRLLLKLKTKPNKTSFDTIGYDPANRIGMPLTVQDADGTVHGSFRPTSISIRGTAATGEIVTSIQGDEV